MTGIKIPRGSVEFVNAPVTADVNLTMTVAIAITKGDAAHVWLPAGWTGAAGTTRTCRTTDPVAFDLASYPAKSYVVYVRLTDTPEIPIIKAGELEIV